MLGLLSIRLVRIHSLGVIPALVQFALLMFGHGLELHEAIKSGIFGVISSNLIDLIFGYRGFAIDF